MKPSGMDDESLALYLRTAQAYHDRTKDVMTTDRIVLRYRQQNMEELSALRLEAKRRGWPGYEDAIDGDEVRDLGGRLVDRCSTCGVRIATRHCLHLLTLPDGRKVVSADVLSELMAYKNTLADIEDLLQRVDPQ